ncbi:MAG: FAD/NAD(P)-binding protein [Planctomycetota bacterium]
MTQLKSAPTPAVPSPYLPRMGKIIEAETFTETEKFFRIVLSDRSHLNHTPGQFIEVSVFGIGEAPISVASSPTQPDSFELCVRNVGHVTNALHALSVGDEVGIRGPFGHGFDTEATTGKDILFVAGGLGLAPTRSFIKYVIDKREQYNNVTILVGAKNPALLLFKKELDAWQSRPDVRCLVTVDRADGSWKGKTGLITTLFRQVAIDARNTIAVIVGPRSCSSSPSWRPCPWASPSVTFSAPSSVA